MSIVVTMTSVRMKSGENKIKLVSPYNPALAPKLRNLGGLWNATDRCWYVPDAYTEQLRAICLEMYGIDPLGRDEPDMVTVRIGVSPIRVFAADWFAMGREIICRPGRDWQVRVGTDVAILSGGFDSRGGSMKHPNIGPAKPDTVIEVRNVPRNLAEAFVGSDAASHHQVEIIEPHPLDGPTLATSVQQVVNLWGTMSRTEREQLAGMIGGEMAAMLAAPKETR